MGIVPTRKHFATHARALVPKALSPVEGGRTLSASGAGIRRTTVSMSQSTAPTGPRVVTSDAWKASRTPSPVEVTAALLRGRFTAVVIWHLFWGGKRFYQLVRELPGVPRKALAHELEELERADVVARRVQGRGPGKVEYRLTPRGESLKIVVGAMYEWGLLARRSANLEASPSDLAEATH